MFFRKALLGIASLAIVATPAFAVGKKKDVSWGKPGVAFADYTADSLECANRAYGVTVEPKPYGPVSMIYGFMPSALWFKLTAGDIPVYTTTYVEGYKHAMWMDTVDQLQDVVDACLEQRGYQRFRLTRAQMSTLKTLPTGTAERQHYLHSLGADGQIVTAQRL